MNNSVESLIIASLCSDGRGESIHPAVTQPPAGPRCDAPISDAANWLIDAALLTPTYSLLILKLINSCCYLASFEYIKCSYILKYSSPPMWLYFRCLVWWLSLPELQLTTRWHLTTTRPLQSADTLMTGCSLTPAPHVPTRAWNEGSPSSDWKHLLAAFTYKTLC